MTCGQCRGLHHPRTNSNVAVGIWRHAYADRPCRARRNVGSVDSTLPARSGQRGGRQGRMRTCQNRATPSQIRPREKIAADAKNPLSHSSRRTASGIQLPNRTDAYAGGFHHSIDSNFTMRTDRIGVRVLVNRHHVGPLSRVVHSGLTRPDLTGRQKQIGIAATGRTLLIDRIISYVADTEAVRGRAIHPQGVGDGVCPGVSDRGRN